MGNNVIADFLAYLTDMKGINLINGKYYENATMSSYDDRGKEARAATPRMEFSIREAAGRPIYLVFERNKQKVRMEYAFEFKSGYQDTMPLIVSDVRLSLKVKEDEKDRSIELDIPYMLWMRPQVAAGKRDFDFEEFVKLKQSIDEGDAYFSWTATLQWIDVTDPKVQEQLKLKDPKNKPKPNVVSIKGEVPVDVSPNSASYDSVFGKVNSMVNWEVVTLDADHRISFKDLRLHNEVCVLPQEYRIKVLPDNSPEMSINVEESKGSAHKAVIRFKVSPYLHPNTKRKLYSLYNQRAGKNYCGVRFGGYEEVKFEWSSDMKNGSLFGADGFVNLKGKDVVEDKENEGDFLITLESPEDGLIKWFMDKISQEEGIEIGKMHFYVKDEGKTATRRLDGIPVILDLRRLTGFNLDVSPIPNNKKVKDIKMPYYQAEITNPGEYPVVINGVALSVLHEGKYIIKDAEHNLKCVNKWPYELKPGGKVLVELTLEQTKKIKKKRFLKVDENYWDRLVCEPYGLRLQDNDIKAIVAKYNAGAVYELKAWNLVVWSNFTWAKFPTLRAVEVKLTHEYGLNKIITLLDEKDRKEVDMNPNLNSKLQTSETERKFKYCVRVFTQDGPKDPQWGEVYEWSSGSSGTLPIGNSDIKPLIENS